MKHLNQTIIILALFLFGCNQTTNKNKVTTEASSIGTTNSQIQENNPDEKQLEDYKIDSINNIIELFKEKSIDKISNKISFPLDREYPIPSIKDKVEFKLRFNEVFDKNLIDKIANSKIDQWHEVGWRGIMLDNGAIWMANSDGIITAINYQSDIEKQLKKDLIAKEKENIHSSLKTFKNPTYKIKTTDYLIRIDELNNESYRYASWKISEKDSSKPDIILNNGELEFQGSGGNHVITFNNNNYTYRVYRNLIGEDDSPAIILEIEKDGHIIITQDGTLAE